jgi:hypothetical protein
MSYFEKRKKEIENEIDAIKNRGCKWELEKDEFANNYQTGCDNILVLTCATPESKNFSFCPFCGGKIQSEVKK